MLLREVLGETLRSARLAQRRTLREISAASTVSLGYLSEIERGQKEASSELLSAICNALGVALSDVLRDASYQLDRGASERGGSDQHVSDHRVPSHAPALADLATVTPMPRAHSNVLVDVRAPAHAA